MSRTCQADDFMERQFEALLKQQAVPEVGLLVGKTAAGATKTLLYGTIKTPSLEGLAPIAVSGTVVGTYAGAASNGTGKASKKAGGAGARTGAGASAAGVNVTLEVDWITEHARQVARMLPGGVSVLGLYVFCPDVAYTAVVPQLCGLLAGLAAVCLPKAFTPQQTTTAAGSSGADAPGGEQHLLLLHIDASSRKQVLRALPASSAAAAAATAIVGSASALRPVELKFGPTLGNLVLLRCWHGVDLALPVPGSAGPGGGGGGAGIQSTASLGQIRRQLAELVAAESERVRCGVFVTPRGTLLPDFIPVCDSLTASESSGFNGAGSGPLHVPTFDLTFLVPPQCQQLSLNAQLPHRDEQRQPQQQLAGLGNSQAVVGQARLRGCIQGLAFVSKRDQVGRAIADLKVDLLSSLSARLELLIEEATRVSEQQQQQDGEPCSVLHPLFSLPSQLTGAGGCDVAMPRRVVLPWLGGGMALCDYLLEGEPTDAAAERARELLALQDCQVIVSELPAMTSATPFGLWRPNQIRGQEELPVGKSKAKAGGGSQTSGVLACSGTMLASLAVAVVASAVGMLSFMGSGPAGAQ